jgi:mannitol/fructose-specific phosphotransferase system IIA component (Ntr-type)
MRSLLDALQEGRLIELPVNDKKHALEYIALLIEAIPGIGTKTDIVKDVIEREKTDNTRIGMGIACPHARTKDEGELLCAVGWSPEGIDYDAIDGKKVHLIMMYYIPDSQRNVYLKEISGLAKAIQSDKDVVDFSKLDDIQAVRDCLLDWVEIVINKTMPDSKARMIKLDVKQSVVESVEMLEVINIPEKKLKVNHVMFTALENEKISVFSADDELTEALEKCHNLGALVSDNTDFAIFGYHIALIGETQYSHRRVMYEAIAIKQI